MYDCLLTVIYCICANPSVGYQILINPCLASRLENNSAQAWTRTHTCTYVRTDMHTQINGKPQNIMPPAPPIARAVT